MEVPRDPTLLWGQYVCGLKSLRTTVVERSGSLSAHGRMTFQKLGVAHKLFDSSRTLLCGSEIFGYPERQFPHTVPNIFLQSQALRVPIGISKQSLLVVVNLVCGCAGCSLLLPDQQKWYNSYNRDSNQVLYTHCVCLSSAVFFIKQFPEDCWKPVEKS